MKTRQKSSLNQPLANKNFKNVLTKINLKQKNPYIKNYLNPIDYSAKRQVPNVYQEWFALNDNAIIQLQNPVINSPFSGGLKKVKNFVSNSQIHLTLIFDIIS